MSAKDWLFYLTIAGGAITAAAAIWGLAKELTVARPEGGKRVTSAGRVAIALAIGGLLVSGVSAGLREVIQQQDKEAAARAEADRVREAARQLRDNRRWDKLISDAEMAETKRQAAGILDRQQLLAALEEARDRDIATRNRLFQIAQGQRIILQSQPLASIDVVLTLGGFSEEEFRQLVEGDEVVESFAETDDTYGRLVDVRGELDNAGRFARVLQPALAWFAGSPLHTDSPTGPLHVMAIDLTGDGSWLLPLGVTESATARGLILKQDWLREANDPYREPVEGQELGPCPLPDISLDPGRREVTVVWSIPSVCAPFAMHRAADGMITARFSESIKAAFFAATPNLLSTSSNFTQTDGRITDRCWRQGIGRSAGRYLEVFAVPNGNREIAVLRKLRYRGSDDMSFQVINEEDPIYYGVCSLYS